jgi:hypothetical protein
VTGSSRMRRNGGKREMPRKTLPDNGRFLRHRLNEANDA